MENNDKYCSNIDMSDIKATDEINLVGSKVFRCECFVLKKLSVIVNSKLHFFPNPQTFFIYSERTSL